jgi:hypothetical protein
VQLVAGGGERAGFSNGADDFELAEIQGEILYLGGRWIQGS